MYSSYYFCNYIKKISVIEMTKKKAYTFLGQIISKWLEGACQLKKEEKFLGFYYVLFRIEAAFNTFNTFSLTGFFQ